MNEQIPMIFQSSTQQETRREAYDKLQPSTVKTQYQTIKTLIESSADGLTRAEIEVLSGYRTPVCTRVLADHKDEFDTTAKKLDPNTKCNVTLYRRKQ